MNATDILYILAIGFVLLLGIGCVGLGIVFASPFAIIMGVLVILICVVIFIGRAIGIPFIEKNAGKDERVWKISDRSVRIAYIFVILAMMAMAFYEMLFDGQIKMVTAFYIVISVGTLAYMGSFVIQRFLG